MSEVIFLYKGNKTLIQSDENKNMKDICIKFSTKLNIDINKIYFLYNGDKLNEELKLIDITKGIDKKEIIILVNDINEIIKKENIISSKEIICPICKENIFINFHNYKINLIKCKNNHNINNIYIKDFKNTQKIDISKIKCEICKKIIKVKLIIMNFIDVLNVD